MWKMQRTNLFQGIDQLNAVIIGTGFISSHLVWKLTKDSINTTVFRHGVLNNKQTVKAMADMYKPDLIVNLSAYGNLASQHDEEEMIKANISNIQNLLEGTKHLGYEKLVNFSTSSTLLPHDTYYSATKLAGEKICHAHALKYNKPIVSVLPYTVIGKREPQEHLIPTLIRSCLKGEKMQFVPDPVHDFIGAEDFVEALRLIIQDYHLGGSVEIGTGVKTSNQEIKNIVEKITGKKANTVEVKSMRGYDTKTWVANPVIIKSLGWKQKETIEDIIKGMVYEQKTKNN